MKQRAEEKEALAALLAAVPEALPIRCRDAAAALRESRKKWRVEGRLVTDGPTVIEVASSVGQTRAAEIRARVCDLLNRAAGEEG